MNRIAFALQRDGVANGDAVAICARTSINYAAAFCGVRGFQRTADYSLHRGSLTTAP
jgi:long-subunit acyl-CoA synthetase (AMP-forming)